MDNSLHTLKDIDKIEIAQAIECNSTELSKYLNIKKDDFTIISQNIRSILCNFDNFIVSLSNFKFETDVIILTECRLSPDKPIPQLDDYYSYATTHHLNQNDGVTIYVKKTLKHSVKEIKLLQASCLQVNILNYTILCIYRSPSNVNTDNFINSLSIHLDSLKSQKNIIIAGDININIKCKDSDLPYELAKRTNYLNMLAQYGILPGHTLPTRDENCLDHFMIKINTQNISAYIAILNTSITDHYTTLLTLSKTKTKHIINKTRSYIDFDQAYKYLLENNIAGLLYCNDPEVLTDLLIYKLIESINNNTIILKIPNSKHIIKPWITEGILRCIKNRNKLQKKYKNDPHNEIIKITYLRYRNHCNNLIKKTKRKYERELITKNITNNKMLWKNIKNITYTNQSNNTSVELLSIKSSPLQSVNYINEYFANIGKELAQKIKRPPNVSCDDLNLRSPQVNSFLMMQTDEDEVKSVLMSLKTHSAPGWDNIPTLFLKHTCTDIVPVITHLANLCFSRGVFPTLLKRAIITPVFKGGDKEEISNYRPISVLPSISKIIEKLINKRLLNYLEHFHILSESQFGFRHGISTEDAVGALTKLVTEHLDRGEKCLTVFWI